MDFESDRQLAETVLKNYMNNILRTVPDPEPDDKSLHDLLKRINRKPSTINAMKTWLYSKLPCSVCAMMR